MAFLGINQFRRVGLRFVRWFHDGNTKRLTESGFMESPRIKPATRGLQGIGLSPTPFCGFPGYKPVPPGWFKTCVGFYNGNAQRLTESGFMEKPGIESATPGLPGIALIPYTTAAGVKKTFCGFPGFKPVPPG